MPNSSKFMRKPLSIAFGIVFSAIAAAPVLAQESAQTTPAATVTKNEDGSTTTTTVTKNSDGSTTTKEVTSYPDGRSRTRTRTVGIPVSSSSSSTSSSTTTPVEPTPVTPAPVDSTPVELTPTTVTTPVVEDMSSYAQIGRIGQLLAAEPVRTLHQRRGEQVKFATDGQQTWVRLLNDRTKQAGKTRFEFTNRTHGLQIGHDIVSYNKDGDFNVTGAYVAHQSARADLHDRFEADADGKLRSRVLSLGLTHTRYAADGSYLDLVGQFSRLQNRLSAEGQTMPKQTGNNLLISAEVGKPFALANGWKAEPQAQLVYQWQKLNSIQDEAGQINFDSNHHLKGRLGGRLAYQAEAAEIYAVANFWHDFRPASKVNFKGHTYRETYAKNSMDIGVGAQYAFNKNTALYGDVRYEYALGSHNKGGIRSDVGIKFNW